MPTALQPVSLQAPGRFGLNSQASSNLSTPDWCDIAENAVFDEQGLLSVRKGSTQLTAPGSELAGAPQIMVIHEYINNSGTSVIISTAATKVYSGTTSFTDITSTTAPTDGQWKFQNFNGKVIGWQASHAPIVWSGAATFADISFDALSGGSHTWGDEVCAAYGRVWTTDSTKTVIKYSSLLDETDFASDAGDASTTVGTTAGVIDLKTVWTDGADQVTAIAAFNGRLVFFGNHQILIYGDLAGTGIDPNASTFGLIDSINKIGCIARDSVQEVDGDLLFLSNSGVYSLGRVVQEKSNPIGSETYNVIGTIHSYISGETKSLIKSVYNKTDKFYVVTFPSYATSYVVDMRGRLEQGQRRITTWTGLLSGGVCYSSTDIMYIGRTGELHTYSGYTDDGTNIIFSWYSGWFLINPENLKAILKNFYVHAATGANTSVTFYWGFDYDSSLYRETSTLAGAVGAEYGTAEYGIAEFGTSVTLTKKGYMGRGYGFVLKFGLQASCSAQFSIQQISLYAKMGRTKDE